MTVASAVVVTWNSAQDVAACIRALQVAAQRTEWIVETVVVDNASGDGSAEVATAAGADAVVLSPVNVGFAAAASLGAARAGGDWVLFVNPDLRVDKDLFAALQAAAIDHPDVGSFAPDVRFAADPTKVDSQGLGVDSAGVPFEIRSSGAPTGSGPRAVFGGSGGAWLLKRELLALHGAFEPAYFAYLEDVDLAWRLQNHGVATLFIPAAKALHRGSSTTGAASPAKAYLVARNRRLLFRLHGPFGARSRVWRMLVELGHCSFQLIQTRSTAPLTGRLAALRTRRYIRFLKATGPHEPSATAVAALSERAGLRATFARKRTASSLHSH